MMKLSGRDFVTYMLGSTAAPEIAIGMARQKEQCDELVAQIRAGTLQQYYLYAFGKIERMWDYVKAVARKSFKEKRIVENEENKAALLAAIENFLILQDNPENIDLLEDRRMKELMALDRKIIRLFVEFYQQTLSLGVDVNLLGYQKGGDWYPEKQERGAGVPILPKMNHD
jgi:hypothetical protein